MNIAGRNGAFLTAKLARFLDSTPSTLPLAKQIAQKWKTLKSQQSLASTIAALLNTAPKTNSDTNANPNINPNANSNANPNANSNANPNKVGADGDAQMQSLYREELSEINAQMEDSLADLRATLLRSQTQSESQAMHAIMEIRPGVGGGEATLFARELFEMYKKYCLWRNWYIVPMSGEEDVCEIESSDGAGAASEVDGIPDVLGCGWLIGDKKGVDNAFMRLRWESGVHRVQRCPATESQGRLHTSTATVAILPYTHKVKNLKGSRSSKSYNTSLLQSIPEKDLRWDSMKSSGPGGQSVNKSNSAIRLTHLPTGHQVEAHSRNSEANKRTAMRLMQQRLEALEKQATTLEQGHQRRIQIGTSERSERIRTYNFPQNRITDHRVGESSSGVFGLLTGDRFEAIDDFAAALERRWEDDLLASLGKEAELDARTNN